MIFLKEIEDVKFEVLNRKQDLIRELEELPEGSFYFITAGSGKRYYYERFPKKGNRKKEKRIAVGKDEERLHGLVRKEYIERALPAIDYNIKLLDDMTALYKPTDENQVMQDFIKSKPELKDYIYSKRGCGFKGAEASQSYNDIYEDDLKSVSSEGTSMRSMAEIAISSRLDHYGISYQYEAPIGIPDLSYVPDFTIKRPRDGMVLYWEHLGMVTDDEYMKHNSRKLDRYYEYGIVPWRNLIVTYGNEKGGINMKQVDAMIQAWII